MCTVHHVRRWELSVCRAKLDATCRLFSWCTAMNANRQKCSVLKIRKLPASQRCLYVLKLFQSNAYSCWKCSREDQSDGSVLKNDNCSCWRCCQNSTCWKCQRTAGAENVDRKKTRAENDAWRDVISAHSAISGILGHVPYVYSLSPPLQDRPQKPCNTVNRIHAVLTSASGSDDTECSVPAAWHHQFVFNVHFKKFSSWSASSHRKSQISGKFNKKANWTGTARAVVFKSKNSLWAGLLVSQLPACSISCWCWGPDGEWKISSPVLSGLITLCKWRHYYR